MSTKPLTPALDEDVFVAELDRWLAAEALVVTPVVERV